jgi:ATP-dependent Clp protease ATP-binding subunit ClpA
MLDRFTDRSRRVLDYARINAKEHGDDMIGTWHLLYGLAKEDSGVGHHVLLRLGIDEKMIESEGRKIVQGGSGLYEHPTYSPKAKNVLEDSVDEAKALNNNYVGTEHLLLAVLRETEGVACQILRNLSVDPAAVRRECLELLGHFDHHFDLKPTDVTNVYSVIMIDGVGSVVVGTYCSLTDMLTLTQPLELDWITRIIKYIRDSDNL